MYILSIGNYLHKLTITSIIQSPVVISKEFIGTNENVHHQKYVGQLKIHE